MIALVEKRIAPKKVMRNPAIVIVFYGLIIGVGFEFISSPNGKAAASAAQTKQHGLSASDSSTVDNSK